MQKIALAAYQGELMCFSHVMLYALDYAAKGYEVAVIIEGAATALITELAKPETPFAGLYKELREKGLIACVCKACATKMGSRDEALRQGLVLAGELQGHPSLEEYSRQGYVILTF